MPDFQIKILDPVESRQPSLIPYVEVPVPRDHKLIGGGARVNWKGQGSLLVASYPEEGNGKWVAKAKSHQVADPCTITAWAIALYDPKDEWDVEIFHKVSEKSEWPRVHMSVNEGYVLTGGGAQVSWDENDNGGSLLTASFPRDSHTWEVRSKSHNVGYPTTIVVYAIGVRPKVGVNPLKNEIFSSTSRPPEQHPSHEVTIPHNHHVTCGGAINNWDMFPGGQGNLLTAIYPFGKHQWKAEGKAHMVGSPSTITVYAVGITNQ